MKRTRLILPALSLLAYACAVGAQEEYSDPPARVARLAYSSGDVEFAPSGESQWDVARRNRPLVTGDRLFTGGNGRAALELGDAAIRINQDSAFDFLNLDDRNLQIQLSQGAVNLRVRESGSDENYEIDTPSLAFVANAPGNYRVDVGGQDGGTTVTVFAGSASVYGDDGTSLRIDAGQSYFFDGSQIDQAYDQGLPQPDSFDRYSALYDARYTRSQSRRYVSAGVIGYDDLDENGTWQSTPEYGHVWYPTHVASNWAPYRDGQWEWVDPYGWTWVDNAQWGFAPYHYGRWVQIANRWGWIPGGREAHAVYAPALVAFVGGSGLSVSVNVGSGEPVGWFPLGPNDVYLPPYKVSRNYFTNVNVTNIRTVNNTVINNTVVNNYYNQPAAAQHINYAYRATPQAVTVVPHNVFAGSRPVGAAMLQIKPGALAHVEVQQTTHVAPTAASLGTKAALVPTGVAAKAFARPVVARTPPPAPPVPFATREKVIASQGGAPVSTPQLKQLQQHGAVAQPLAPPVRVIPPAAIAAHPPQSKPVAPAGAAKVSPPSYAPPAAAARPKPSAVASPAPAMPGAAVGRPPVTAPNAPGSTKPNTVGAVSSSPGLPVHAVEPAKAAPKGNPASAQLPAQPAVQGRVGPAQQDKGKPVDGAAQAKLDQQRLAQEQQAQRAQQLRAEQAQQTERAASQQRAAEQQRLTQTEQAQRAEQARTAKVQAERNAAQQGTPQARPLQPAAMPKQQPAEPVGTAKVLPARPAPAQSGASESPSGQQAALQDQQTKRAEQLRAEQAQQAERAAAQQRAAPVQAEKQRLLHEQQQAQPATQQHPVQAQDPLTKKPKPAKPVKSDPKADDPNADPVPPVH